jgi:nitrate reductase NapD
VQYSGIVVRCRPASAADVAARLAALPGVEVHARHDPSGRFVVVQEAPDVDAHERRFREIESLPGVIGASLVSHAADPQADPA